MVNTEIPHGAGDDGAFAAGAFDSLSAVELSSTLGGQLGLQLPGTLAFDYPSVTAVAAHVHSLLTPDDAALALRHVSLDNPAEGLRVPHPGAGTGVVRVRDLASMT